MRKITKISTAKKGNIAFDMVSTFTPETDEATNRTRHRRWMIRVQSMQAWDDAAVGDVAQCAGTSSRTGTVYSRAKSVHTGG